MYKNLKVGMKIPKEKEVRGAEVGDFMNLWRRSNKTTKLIVLLSLKKPLENLLNQGANIEQALTIVANQETKKDERRKKRKFKSLQLKYSNVRKFLTPKQELELAEDLWVEEFLKLRKIRQILKGGSK